MVCKLWQKDDIGSFMNLLFIIYATPTNKVYDNKSINSKNWVKTLFLKKQKRWYYKNSFALRNANKRCYIQSVEYSTFLFDKYRQFLPKLIICKGIFPIGEICPIFTLHIYVMCFGYAHHPQFKFKKNLDWRNEYVWQ